MSDSTTFGGGRSRRVGVNPTTLVNKDGVQQLRPSRSLFELVFFTDDGTPSGDEDQKTNSVAYSPASPGIFFIEPDPGTIMVIYEIHLSISDTNVAPTRWGGIVGGLTDGLRVVLREGSTEITDILAGRAFQQNKGLSAFASRFQSLTFGIGAEQLVATWSMAALGGVVTLDGDIDENLAILVQDDITALDSQEAGVACAVLVK